LKFPMIELLANSINVKYLVRVAESIVLRKLRSEGSEKLAIARFDFMSATSKRVLEL